MNICAFTGALFVNLMITVKVAAASYLLRRDCSDRRRPQLGTVHRVSFDEAHWFALDLQRLCVVLRCRYLVEIRVFSGRVRASLEEISGNY